MNASQGLREKLLRLVANASDVELQQMAASLEMMREKSSRIQRIIAHLGSWSDMPDDAFSLLTTNLHQDRESRRDSAL